MSNLNVNGFPYNGKFVEEADYVLQQTDLGDFEVTKSPETHPVERVANVIDLINLLNSKPDTALLYVLTNEGSPYVVTINPGN